MFPTVAALSFKIFVPMNNRKKHLRITNWTADLFNDSRYCLFVCLFVFYRSGILTAFQLGRAALTLCLRSSDEPISFEAMFIDSRKCLLLNSDES